MVEFIKLKIKDLGLQREVFDALPYANVGGAWEASFDNPVDTFIALTHIVPAGHQLKILFLRITTQEAGGARFSIQQANPAIEGLTGAVEAFPVVGSVPPFADGASGTRDYPMLEAPGAEVLHGGLRDPIHVLEGSIDFKVHDTPTPATGSYYSLTWWGVEKIPEE